jgi:hypothetical protein
VELKKSQEKILMGRDGSFLNERVVRGAKPFQFMLIGRVQGHWSLNYP